MIERADEIDLVNMSWGAAGHVPQLNQLHDRLLQAGIVDVVAAGNDAEDGGSPATSDGAFSVGAVDREGNVTRFSSSDQVHDNPDVMAVGKDIRVARAPGTSMGRVLSDDYVKASGTSFSAPLLGSAMLEALRMSKKRMDHAFEKYAPDIPGTPRDGGGLLKVQPVLKHTENAKQVVEAALWNFNGHDMMYLDAEWLPEGDTKVEKTEETADSITLRVYKP
jgi:subtilisin family serine protease